MTICLSSLALQLQRFLSLFLLEFCVPGFLCVHGIAWCWLYWNTSGIANYISGKERKPTQDVDFLFLTDNFHSLLRDSRCIKIFLIYDLTISRLLHICIYAKLIRYSIGGEWMLWPNYEKIELNLHQATVHAMSLALLDAVTFVRWNGESEKNLISLDNTFLMGGKLKGLRWFNHFFFQIVRRGLK